MWEECRRVSAELMNMRLLQGLVSPRIGRELCLVPMELAVVFIQQDGFSTLWSSRKRR